MKVKSRPEDFRVEELTDFESRRGSFALYRLEKESIGTLEALDAIRERWQIKRQAVGVGGMKDRHAITSQHITIRNGPRRNLQQTHINLIYLGPADREFGPQDIAGNRFQVVLRDLSAEDVDRAHRALDEVRQEGYPNYFDDQRFGSVGQSKDFIARAWCEGDYERALWLALADPSSYDRSKERADKKTLREKWGNWKACKNSLRRSPRRSVITYLCDHPQNFRDAFVLIRSDLRRIYLSAYQSYLWNLLLSDLIERKCPPDKTIPIRVGNDRLLFYRGLDSAEAQALADWSLPLPSSRREEADPEIEWLYADVLGRLDITERKLRVKYPRDSFFSKGSRAAVCSPRDLSASSKADELNPGRRKLILRFSLPRGSYATILAKRLGVKFAHRSEE